MVEDTVVERVDYDPEKKRVVATVRPKAKAKNQCGICRRRSPRHDNGKGLRQWRALDLAMTECYLAAAAPRVKCRDHGIVVAHVPWAQHHAGHTRTFDQLVAWLATETSKTAVTQLMRITWRTVGSIIARVFDETTATLDPVAGLTRIGIDEISYKRGYRYLMAVTDHDRDRLVWMGEGRDTAALQPFFDLLGTERAKQITHVTADGAEFITRSIAANCSNDVIQCADPFHIYRWASDAMDEVRKQAQRDAATTDPKPRRGRPRKDAPPQPEPRLPALKKARRALWKGAEHLTPKQQVKIDWIARTDPNLYFAYQLKEALRTVLQLDFHDACEALDDWMEAAADSGLPPFEELAKRIRIHQGTILNAIKAGLSNARAESMNTKIRLLIRKGFGFHHADAIIALAMLVLGGHKPTLPGRT